MPHDDDHQSAPSASRNDSTLVDQLNDEYRRNPAAGDAPPPEAPPSGPEFASTELGDGAAEEPKKPSLTSGVLGAIQSFFAPAPKKGEVPKNPVQRKRALDQAKRTQRFGVRYGGDRKRWFTLQALFIGFFALSLIAFLVAVQKPSRDAIRQEVAAQLTESGRGFPTGQAVMWAGQVLRVWGTWDERNRETREVLLAPYLSAGMDSHAGWNGKGTQQVMYAAIDPQPKVLNAHYALVRGSYQIQDGSWHCVSIPLYAYQPKEFAGDAPWAFALSNNPTPVGCPPRTGAPDAAADDIPSGMTANEEIGQTLASGFLPGFFAAWGASDTDALAQYTAPGVTTMGLGGSVQTVPPPTIGDTYVVVPESGAVDGHTYQASTVVNWTAAGSSAQVSATYLVDLRKQGDRWYVVSEPIPAPYAQGAAGAPGTVPQPEEGKATMGNYPTDQPTPTNPPASANPSDGSTAPASPPASSATAKQPAKPAGDSGGKDESKTDSKDDSKDKETSKKDSDNKKDADKEKSKGDSKSKSKDKKDSKKKDDEKKDKKG